ncbi:MAG: BMC domain-containing protein [Planctomycetota bacterium]
MPLHEGAGVYRGAIGIIETIGQIGSIEAADAMTKCAEVELLGREEIGGGYHSVCVRGDVGSVRAALEAGVRASEVVGRVAGVLLIPRPHDDIDRVIDGFGGSPRDRLPSTEDLGSMNVHELRNLARRTEDFPLRGREISRANRDRLLELLRGLLTSRERPAGQGGAGAPETPEGEESR